MNETAGIADSTRHSCRSGNLSDPCEPWTCTECGRSFSGTVLPRVSSFAPQSVQGDWVEYVIIAAGVLVACFLGILIGVRLCLL